MFSYHFGPPIQGPALPPGPSVPAPEPVPSIEQPQTKAPEPEQPAQTAITQQISEAESDENVVIIPIDRSFSDGDTSTWPTEERFGRPDDSNYRQKLAEMWSRKTGAYESGVTYIIDELPEGYAIFDRPRQSNPAIRDRFLWGHPIGQYFSSTIVFFPHFYYLMTGGISKCPCQLCDKLERRQKGSRPRKHAATPTSNPAPDAAMPMPARRGRPPGRPAGRPPGTSSEGTPVRTPGRPRGRPPGSGGRAVVRGPGRPSGLRRGRPPGYRPAFAVTDSEGTPDVYKFAIAKLKKEGKLDNNITESTSMDWRAERDGMDEYLETLDMQSAYLPRLGELVLWTPDFEGELLWNEKAQCLQIYTADKNWLEKPQWRAGVIGQLPTEETALQDLVEPTGKKWGLNYSGFRVETLPDPNGSDKSYSLHYGYVPLKCIKPFNAFEHFLQGTPREQLHPSIEHAMTVMSSFSLVDKYRFKGVWPNASIYSRGIFIGAEFLTIGDTIRLKPNGYNPKSNNQLPPAVDVMVIKEIRLDLTDCDDDTKSKHLAEKIQVRISGRVFTTSLGRAHSQYQTQPLPSNDNNIEQPQPLLPHEVLDVFNTGGMTGYGPWYTLHQTNTVSISLDMVLGRCWEPDALHLLLNSTSLSHDLPGILSARSYSRSVDERIPEGKLWFWGDFRTQTLGIDSLNGQDVGHYSEARDVKMWRANLRILDGTASQADLRAAKHPGDLGRPSMKDARGLVEVSKTSKLVSAGLGAVDTSNPVSETSEQESEDVGVVGVQRGNVFAGCGSGSGRGGVIGGAGSKEEGGSESSEAEEDFTTRMEELRGGTEETEGGDYVPEKEHEGPNSKRQRHAVEMDFEPTG
ncbi:transcription-silencing protein Clr2-domain-containing protein [Aspergillus venezuelensis]